MSSNLEHIKEAFDQTPELTQELSQLRSRVTMAFEEYLTFGARVRPLKFKDTPVGFLRGIYPGEKGWILRMYEDPKERMYAFLGLATSVSREFIDSLSTVELQRLLLIIHRFSQNDYALLNWVYPYSTTTSSERLLSAGVKPPQEILIPSGSFKPVCPPDMYSLWSYLTKLREDSKKNLQEASNNLMIVRALVGKQAQGLASEIKNAQKAMQPNHPEPWKDTGVVDENFDPEDGWGHIIQDDSVEGIMREFNGMLEGDKHEQMMRSLAENQKRKAEEEHNRILSMRERSGRVAGISSYDRILTNEEVRAQDAKRAKDQMERLKQGMTERVRMLEASEAINETRQQRVWDVEL